MGDRGGEDLAGRTAGVPLLGGQLGAQHLAHPIVAEVGEYLGARCAQAQGHRIAQTAGHRQRLGHRGAQLVRVIDQYQRCRHRVSAKSRSIRYWASCAPASPSSSVITTGSARGGRGWVPAVAVRAPAAPTSSVARPSSAAFQTVSSLPRAAMMSLYLGNRGTLITSVTDTTAGRLVLTCSVTASTSRTARTSRPSTCRRCTTPK